MSLYVVHLHCSYLNKDDEEYYQDLIVAPGKAEAVLQAVLLHLDLDIDEGYIYDQYGRLFDLEECRVVEVDDSIHQKIMNMYMHPTVYNKAEVNQYLDYVCVGIIKKRFKE